MKRLARFMLVYQGDMDELVRDQWYWWELYLGLCNMRLWVVLSGVRDALDAVFEGEGEGEGGAER